jgi:branched-chain amino acid transport system ATP-binding protein
VQTIYAALANLRDARIGVLVVEQSVERAVERSDRCYVMEQGNIELSGPASEIAGDERVQMIVRGVASPDRPGTSDTPAAGDRGDRPLR